MKHREAVESLAEHLTFSGYRAYPELRVAGWQTTEFKGVADVLAMRRFAYGATTWRLDAYEVKVSLSDMRADIRAGKWSRYASEHGVRFVWFALADDAAVKASAEVPKECGVVVFNGESGKWRVKRTPHSLQHNLAAVNPMILIAMMDAQPFEVDFLWDRAKRIRSIGAARDLAHVAEIEKMGYGELKQVAKSLGVKLRGALAAPEPVNEKLVAWADNLLAKWCALAGLDVEQTKAAIAYGHFHDALMSRLEYGLKRLVARDHLQKLLQAAQLLLNGEPKEKDWTIDQVADADEIAESITSLSAELNGHGARRKRKKGTLG